MSEELCRQCGMEDCDGSHICVNCGKDAPNPMEVDGDFYCDKYCLYSKNSKHPILAGVPSEDFKAFEKRAEIVGKMRALRKEAEEAGVAWIS